MKQKTMAGLMGISLVVALAVRCSQPSEQSSPTTATSEQQLFGGVYATEVAWGDHLVRVGGCGDCHTPKKMTDKGPVQDSSLLLSGHPAQMPAPPVDQKELAAKGVAATQTLTAWVGPWGTSYAANISSDSTGIGNWKYEQFEKAIREGKYHGLDGSRPIMPPMPLEALMHYTDDEMKAIFAYLKSTPPVKNVVPAYQPPAQ
jgi:mono/diheme cytochrome c family protein